MPVLIIIAGVAFVAVLIAVAVLFTKLDILSVHNAEIDKNQTEAIVNLERSMRDLMTNQLKEIRDNVNSSSGEMSKQIHSFTQETVGIREDLKQLQGQVKEVSSFQDIFKSPKLRGEWGEASLEHILSQYFPRELYESQHLFSSGEQVDCVLKLPNGKLLSIDAKFPLENFSKMVNSQNEDDRQRFRKTFVDDVKKKIQDINQKYILPGEGTVEWALMYVPAEAVYTEIVNNSGMDEITVFAASKKVYLTSPNQIYGHLWAIEHWFKDTQVSRQTQKIVERLGKIRQDAEKLMDEFRKLGNHLKNASSAYNDSEKRLTLFEEKVEKLIDTDETKKLNPGGE